MKLRSLLIFKLGLLITLIWLAVATQNLSEIWALIAGANYFYLLLFFIFNAASVALASSNLYLLLRPLGKEISWRQLFYFDRLSLAGSSYTPGSIGGLGVLIFMMSREGIGLKDSTVAVLVDKIITLIIALLFLTIYLLAYHGGMLEIEWKWYWLAALALFAACTVSAAFAFKWVRQSVAKILDRVSCYRGHYRLLAANTIITLGILITSALQIIVAFSSVGIEMKDWVLVLFTYGALLLINYLPISFGGIGLGEAAGVFLWSQLGIASEEILAAFLIWRIFNLISVVLLGGPAVVVWLMESHRDTTIHGTT